MTFPCCRMATCLMENIVRLSPFVCVFLFRKHPVRSGCFLLRHYNRDNRGSDETQPCGAAYFHVFVTFRSGDVPSNREDTETSCKCLQVMVIL
uniref:Uncharacterized protein n=1 Tax=Anguilla anguilla TaxID=7936 RepID=A0A0E9RYK2_ANGAN